MSTLHQSEDALIVYSKEQKKRLIESLKNNKDFNELFNERIQKYKETNVDASDEEAEAYVTERYLSRDIAGLNAAKYRNVIEAADSTFVARGDRPTFDSIDNDYRDKKFKLYNDYVRNLALNNEVMRSGRINVDNTFHGIDMGTGANSPLQLHYNRVKAGNQTARQLIENLDRINTNGMIVFDTETTGGFGAVNGVYKDSQAITQFSFWAADANGQVTGNPFSSIIGSSAEEDSEYRTIIKKVKEGKKLTDAESVTYKQLNLAGASSLNLTPDFMNGKTNGIIEYTKYAEESDLGTYSTELAEAGAKRLRDIGMVQETHLQSNGLKHYEQQMLSALESAMGQDGRVIVAHNAKFDINRLLEYGKSSKATQAYKDRIKQLNNGKMFEDSIHVLDTLSVLQQVNTNHAAFYDNLFNELSPDDPSKRIEFEKYLKANPSFSGNKQEVQRKALELLYPDLAAQLSSSGAKHSSIGDIQTLALLSGLQKHGFFARAEQLQGLAKQSRVLNKGEDLFYAGKSIGFNKNLHIFSYQLDNTKPVGENRLIGEIRSSDGVSVNSSGYVRKELLKQRGLRKRTLSTFEGLEVLDINSEFSKLFIGAHPEYEGQQLYSFAMKEYDPTHSNTVDTYHRYVGSLNELEATIGKLEVVAHKNADGQFVITQEAAKLHSRLRFDAEGRKTVEEATLEDLVNTHVKALQAGAIRSDEAKSFSKDEGIVRFVNARQMAFEEHLKKNNITGVLDVESERIRFYEQFNKQAVSMTQELYSQESAHNAINDTRIKFTRNQLAYSGHSFFGWTYGQETNVLIETVNNSIARASGVERQLDLYEYMLNQADLAAKRIHQQWGGDFNSLKKTRQLTYERIRSRIENAALARVENSGIALGINSDSRIDLSDYENKFEFEYAGKFGTPVEESNIVSFSIKGMDPRIAEQHLTTIGKTEKQIKNLIKYEPEVVVRHLQQLQNAMGITAKNKRGRYTISKDYKDVLDGSYLITEDDSIQTAQGKIARSIETIREKHDATFGIISQKNERNLELLDQIPWMGLDEEEAKQIIDDEASKAIKVAGRRKSERFINGKINEAVATAKRFGVNTAEDDVASTSEKMTNIIMENVIFGKKKSDFLAEYTEGMAEHDRKIANAIVDKYYNEYSSFTFNMVQNVIENGGQVEVAGGRVFVNSIGEKPVDINMPRLRTKNRGLFFVNGNGQEYASELHLTMDSNGSSLRFQTTAGLYMDDNSPGKIFSNFKRAGENGDLGRRAKEHIQGLTTLSSTAAGVIMKDGQDIRNTDGINLKRLPSILSTFNSGDFNLHPGELTDPLLGENIDSVLSELIGSDSVKANVEFDELDVKYKSAILKRISTLRNGMRGRFSEEDQILLDSIHTNGNNIASGHVPVMEEKINAGELYSANAGRHIEDALSRSQLYKVDPELLEEAGIKNGAVLTTNYQKAYSTAAGTSMAGKMDKTFRGKVLQIETSRFKEILGERLGSIKAFEGQSLDQIYGSYLYNRLEQISTRDGAGAISSYVVDAAAYASTAETVINMSKIQKDNANLYSTLVANAKQNLSIGDLSAYKAGEAANIVKFNYNKGIYIRRGDILGYSDQQYGGGAIKAKYDGFASLSVYKNGVLQSDEEIQNVLNGEDVIARLRRIGDSAAASMDQKLVDGGHSSMHEAVFNILQEKGYKVGYSLHAVNPSDSRKIAYVAEKSASQSLAVGAGAIDDNIKTFMHSVGLSKYAEKDIGTIGYVYNQKNSVRSSEAMLELINGVGRYDGRKAISERDMAFKMLQSGFGSNIAATTAEELTENNINTILENFSVAFKKERHALSDAVRDLFGGVKIAAIANTESGAIKHGTPREVRNYITYLLDSDEHNLNMTADSVVKLLQERGVVGANALSVDSNGNIIESEKEFIKTFSAKNFLNLLKDDTYGTKKHVEATKRNGYEIVNMEMESMSFHDRANIIAEGKKDGLRKLHTIDQKVLTNMYNDAYVSEEGLNAIQKALVNAAEIQNKAVASLGDSSHMALLDGNELFKKFFGDVKAGDLIQKEFFKDAEQRTYYTEGQVFVHDATGVNKTHRKAADRLYEEAGISVKAARATEQALIERGAQRLTVDKVINQYSLSSYEAARNFNTGKSGISLDTMNRLGFNLVNVAGVKVDQESVGLKNSIYGNAVVVDLYSDALAKSGRGQIYGSDESKRFLALPFIDQQTVLDSEKAVADKPQALMKDLVMKMRDLSDPEKYQHDGARSDIDRVFEEARTKYQDIIKQVATEAESKKSVMHEAAKVSYGFSATATAGEITLHGSEKGDLSKLHFHGINLAEQAKIKKETTEKRYELEDELAGLKAKRDRLNIKGELGLVEDIDKKIGALEKRRLEMFSESATASLDISYSIMGKDIRDKWYDDKRLAKMLGIKDDDESLGQFKDTLFNELSTGGLTGIETRWPANYAQSNGMAQLYFLDSTPTNNFIGVSGTRFNVMKGDWDTDTVTNVRKTYIAELKTKNSDKYLRKELDTAEFNALIRMRDSGAADGLVQDVKWAEGQEEAVNQDSQQIIKTAVDSNPNNSLSNEASAISKGGALSGDTILNFTIDGDRIIDKSGFDDAQRDKFARSLKDFKQLQKDFWYSNFEDTEEGRMKAERSYKTAYKLWDEGAESSQVGYDFTNSIGLMLDESKHGQFAGNERAEAVLRQVAERKDEFYEALKYNHQMRIQMKQVDERVAKGGAGLIDHGLYVMQLAMQSSGALSGTDIKAMQALRPAINEHGIAAKNGALDVEALDELNDATNAYYRAAKTGQDRTQAIHDLMDVYGRMAGNGAGYKTNAEGVEYFDYGKSTKEFMRVFGESSYAGESAPEFTFKRIEKALWDMDLSHIDIASLTVGIRKSDPGTRRTVMTSSANKVNLEQEKLKDVMAIQDKMMADSSLRGSVDESLVDRVDVENTTPKKANVIATGKSATITSEAARRRNTQKIVESLEDSLPTDEALNGTRSVLGYGGVHATQTIKKVASSIGGKFGAMMAGIGAGLLTAGYATGPIRDTKPKHPAPAQTQAAGAASDEDYYNQQGSQNTMRPVNTLSDANLNVQRGGARTGYAININASSPGGTERAARAISAAAQSSMPQSSNINISVNSTISDKTSQLQFGNMFANAMGLY